MSDNKVFDLKKVARFLNDILSGKKNKYNPEKEYVEKIMTMKIC